ncbi:MAG: sigma 54-interacting transcriptional regulator [Desulfurivibrio sp.]|nr:sigma 54-interacting transcriptional regulator [Desulfurivibrio sp.]
MSGTEKKGAESAAGVAMIGRSGKIQQVFELISKVADADTTVLVRGESGTGKELVAQALHREGVRGSGPFVAVNCGAIPSELLESELFSAVDGGLCRCQGRSGPAVSNWPTAVPSFWTKSPR